MALVRTLRRGQLVLLLWRQGYIGGRHVLVSVSAIFPFFMVGVENSDLGDRTADLGDWAEAPDFGERPAAEAEWSAELAGDRRRSSAFWPVRPVTWVKLLVLDSTSSVVVLAPNPPDGDASLLQKPPEGKITPGIKKKKKKKKRS